MLKSITTLIYMIVLLVSLNQVNAVNRKPAISKKTKIVVLSKTLKVKRYQTPKELEKLVQRLIKRGYTIKIEVIR